ncbi:MAG: hypothetical protein MUC29_04710 [Pyrinomonadaceae bacterium]|jgi:hypothetical protein|nr:hypothetical protein [Pyrinomonadaceae bacterium]
MKNFKILLIVSCVCLVGFLVYYSPISLQKKSLEQWEYCVVNYTGIEPSTEHQPVIVGIANICYFEANGCKNELVKSELTYGRYLQDFSLQNNPNALLLAQNRVRDLVYAKTLAKLGLDGWELVSNPEFSFDDYVSNNKNTFDIYPQNKDLKKDVYFKRLKP